MTKKKIIFFIIGNLIIFIIFYNFVINPHTLQKKLKEQNKTISEPKVKIIEEFFRGYEQNDRKQKERNYAFPKDPKTLEYIIPKLEYTDGLEQKFQNYYFNNSEKLIIGEHMIKISYTFYGLNLDKSKVEHPENMPILSDYDYVYYPFKIWQKQDILNSKINENFVIYNYNNLLNDKDKKTKLTKTSDTNDYLTFTYEGPKSFTTDSEYKISWLLLFKRQTEMDHFNTIFSWKPIQTEKGIVYDIYFNPVKKYLTLYKTEEQLKKETEKTKKLSSLEAKKNILESEMTKSENSNIENHNRLSKSLNDIEIEIERLKNEE